MLLAQDGPEQDDGEERQEGVSGTDGRHLVALPIEDSAAGDEDPQSNRGDKDDQEVQQEGQGATHGAQHAMLPSSRGT